MLQSRHLPIAGELDLTFGNAGKVLTKIGDAPYYNPDTDVVSFQSDRKVVAAGITDGGDYDFSVIRYNSDCSAAF